ncbi:MAG: Rrf2 family transcriptional regulator [Calditrichaeota bacterium]|nr:Rrf2 family transcriptional regulator [Calditrichota bacterium]
MNVLIKREYDYAIRICAYLAGNYQKGPISLAAISQKLFITRPFATKIIYKLKQHHIIGTTQGKRGGVFLTYPPEKLSFYKILQAMGFDFALNECIKNPNICPLVSHCKIHLFFVKQDHYLMRQLQEAMISEFIFGDSDLEPKPNGTHKKGG